MEIARAEEEEVNKRLQLLMDEGTRLEESNEMLSAELQSLQLQLQEAQSLQCSEMQRAVQEAERAKRLADELLALSSDSEFMKRRYEEELEELRDKLEEAGARLAEVRFYFLDLLNLCLVCSI